MLLLKSFILSANLVLTATAAVTLTAVPSQPVSSSSTYTYSVSAKALALSSISYSFPYTVTTPTTRWQAPAFATPAPLPPCSDTVCPSQNGKQCIDVFGNVYGILCNTFISGIVITNSGKKFLRHKDKRGYTGTFEACLEFCDAYSIFYCAGVRYQKGQCMAFDTITGTFSDPAGGWVGIRQS
ncbi:hypothetical protein LTR09_005057 [Extremus antarcticus]|uniref:Apple domain-containing protein n=1 Tax=Extremus antarcticus TaxID=702011 RepID=A0AAJ0DGU0_9PEZI|nr:hypothetical protein LTR09_005057 [Extremus antarcticus]